MQYDVVRIDDDNIVIAYLWSEWAKNHFVWLNIKATRSEYEIKRKMLNAQLILKGYAKYKHIPGNEKYADFFEEFEQEAKKKKLGIWKEK